MSTNENDNSEQAPVAAAASTTEQNWDDLSDMLTDLEKSVLGLSTMLTTATAIKDERYPPDMRTSENEDVEGAAAVAVAVAVIEETAPEPSCEELDQMMKKMEEHLMEQIKEDREARLFPTQPPTALEQRYEQEMSALIASRRKAKDRVAELELHKTNMKQQRKALDQENKELRRHVSVLSVENMELLMENQALKKDNRLAHQAKEEVADEVARVRMVCVLTKAHNDRTIAALSKIFVEQQEAQEQEGITEMEGKVIDHCLRQLTDEERAKFLCECGSLDGGFVFRNQVRREMDAIGRDPGRLAEMFGGPKRVDDAARAFHNAVEGPSQEVQEREKRKGKGKRRQR